jgi:hypothetical protein
VAPRLAIVIPALGPTDALENSLVSVLERRPPGCEIIVALNAPYADPYDLAEEVRFVDAARGVGLAELLVCGVSAAEAPIVHVLSAGCEVTDGWTSAMAHFENARVAAVVPRIAALDDRERTLSHGVRLLPGGLRTIHSGSPPSSDEQLKGVWGPTLLAGFYRRSALDAVGASFVGLGDEFADVLLAAALHRSRSLIAWEPASLVLADAASVVPQTGKLRRAWRSQCLWTQTKDLFGERQSLTGLMSVTMGEFFGSLPWPSAIGQPLARLAATVLGAGRRSAVAQTPPANAPKPVFEQAFRRRDRGHSAGERRETYGVAGSGSSSANR